MTEKLIDWTETDKYLQEANKYCEIAELNDELCEEARKDVVYYAGEVFRCNRKVNSDLSEIFRR